MNISEHDGQSFKQARENTDYWGSLVETSVGAHLVCGSLETDYKIFYWREKNSEVDFVLQKSDQIIAIEVKSGRKKEALPGLNIFFKHYPSSRTLLVGVGGMPVDEFLSINPSSLFNE